MAQAAQAVVLAGGLAQRMGALAATCPKYLLPIAGEPFAARQLRRLASCGVSDVVLCIGHLGEQIEAAVGDGNRYGVRVRYSHEGPTRRGTAGALHHALPLLHDTFLLTYGDSYLPFDYLAPLRLLGRTPAALAVMAVYANEHRFDRSNVAVTDGWVRRYDKGRQPLRPGELDHIDYGATALRREAVARVHPALAASAAALAAEGDAEAAVAVDLAPLFTRLAEGGKLAACRVKQRFYEIGSPSGYAELNRLWQHAGDPALLDDPRKNDNP